jgi:hypothetical protein
MEYETLSNRIMCIKMKVKPVDLFLIQVCAPTLEADEQETEVSYEDLMQTVQKHKKSGISSIKTGDFNGKVDCSR